MPDHNLPSPLEISVDLELQDYLFGAWTVYSGRRDNIKLRNLSEPPGQAQTIRQAAMSFTAGVCLGTFHVAAASWVLTASANALGYTPQIASEYAPLLGGVPRIVGFIWLWLLAGETIQKYRYERACKKLWRKAFPEIFDHAVSVSISFTDTSVASTVVGRQNSIPVGRGVRLVETDTHYLLTLDALPLPLPKSRLSEQTARDMIAWAAAHAALYAPVSQRRKILPPNVSAGLGVALCLACLWVGSHVKIWSPPPAQTRSVNLALPNTDRIVAGQVVHLEQLNYTATNRYGAFYDSLAGTVSRPEITGTFFADRYDTPNLARTAQDEFVEERTWPLIIGRIPADAAIEELPASGVLITWEQPLSADYPGNCAALRANADTTKLSGGRFLFRRRLYLAVCSPSMSKADLKTWSLQAIAPLNRELVLQTQ